MRSFYIAFLLGLSIVVSVGTLLKKSIASSAGSDLKVESVERMEDKELSGLKAPVPLSNELAESLKKKEDELSSKEKRLREREDLLTVEEERLKLRIEELQKLQAEFADLKKSRSAEEQTALARTVKTYETMNPKKAGAVLTLMQQDLAVKILQGMKEKKIASILDSMNPEDANRLSSALANRKPAGGAVNSQQVTPESGQEVLP